jgi:hypothetical protein
MSDEPRAERWTRVEAFGLLAVLTLGLALRMRHLDTLLPWFIYEDEVRITGVTLQLLRDWTINPHHTFYPALPFYLNAVAYWLWAAPGQLGAILRHGPSAVAPFFTGLAETDPRLIMISRWVSLSFGMGALLISHLLFRQYLRFRFALFATLLLALNPVAVSMSNLAKADAIYLFWFAAVYYTAVKYFHRGGYPWLLAAAACAGFGIVTKNNYTISFPLTIVFLARNLRLYPRVIGILRSPQLWAMFLTMGLFAFIGSPYSFIHFQETMTTAGWLYVQSEIISTYHTDPHAWWLDRYSYLFSIVLPFVLGLPLFWLGVAGAVHNFRKYALRDPCVFYLLILYLYIFASNSGGPRGGAFAYYLFLITVPLAILVAVDLLSDLQRSPRRSRRALAYALFLIILASSLAGVDSFHNMFFAPYDRLGPWLRLNLPGDARTLMVSVYKPGPGLAGLAVKSVWPHEFNPELIESYDPDNLVFDSWAVAGFRKVYRELPVAPLVDSFLDGKRGYHKIWELPADYFGRGYFAALDPEHDVVLTVLRRPRPETRTGETR